MSEKIDFIKRLREHPKYREALGRARNAAERKAISNIIEGMVGDFATVLGPAIDMAQTDPEFGAKLTRALKERNDVVSKQSPTTVSGSI